LQLLVGRLVQSAIPNIDGDDPSHNLDKTHLLFGEVTRLD
jgi:hypothetical protein